MPIALLPAAAFGLIIGSFLNVVAYRLPARVSLSRPGSHCPSCETPIKPYDNIPLLSWLLLRGRCRGCSAPIAKRYPLVEAGTAVLFAAVVAVHYADTASLVLGLVLVAFLVPIALIDFDSQIIPNRLTAARRGARDRARHRAGSGRRDRAPDRRRRRRRSCSRCPSLLHPKGMGMGDAKLVGVLGLYLGAAVAPAFFIALIVGMVGGVAIMIRKGAQAGRKTRVPFGPFLALGGVVGVLAGNELVALYAGTF